MVNNTGEVIEYNSQCLRQVNGMQNAIKQVTYVLNGSTANLLPSCRIIKY